MKSELVVAVLVCAGFVGGVVLRAQETMTIERVGWLQGCWRGTMGDRLIEEQWMTPRAGGMLGMARATRGSETTNYEMTFISVIEDRLAYEAHPSDQPSATFMSIIVTADRVVFENKAHDFPQRVGYERKGADGLLAWIEGDIGGKSQRLDYSYTRARCDAR